MTEIKNLSKAALRIKKAVKNKEKIVIYGDSDMDGVASAIILKEAIMNLGGQISAFYFPDREHEGYGVTKKALKELKKFAPGLFITVDCGISSFDEIDQANKMKFKVIVVDHHEILDKLPKAEIIVDPKQKGDKYPFKEFANGGIAFKLAEKLLGKNITENLRLDLIQLAAMATIADMVPKKEDNEIIVSEGVNTIDSSWRPGIKAMLELVDTNKGQLEKVSKMNSYLNIRESGTTLPAAFRLLTISDEQEAKEMARHLIEKAAEKRRRVNEITDEIKMLISAKGNVGSGEPVVVEGNSAWELVLLGIAASNIVKEVRKPVFLYKKLEKESHGSVRAPEGLNTVEAMKKFSKKLITFGGHPVASGFRIKNKYLEEFKEFLMEYFSK